MTHERALELAVERAYGELPEGGASELEAHLAACGDCRAEVARMASTLGLMRRLGPEPEPPGERVLVAAAREAAARRKETRRWTRWIPAMAGLAAAGGVAVIALQIRAPEESLPAADRELAASRAAADQVPGTAPSYAPAPPSAPEALAPSPQAAGAPAPVRQRSLRKAKAEGAAVTADEAVRSESAPAVRQERAPGTLGRDAPAPAAPPAAAEPGVLGRAAAPAMSAEAKAGQPPEPLAHAGVRAPPQDVFGGKRAAVADAERPRPASAPDAEAMVRELERAFAAGELNESRRKLERCAGGDGARAAWFDGWGKARRLTRTGPLPPGMGAGEATRDQWYDAQGRLRLARVSGSGPAGPFARRLLFDETGRRLLEDPPGAAPWPAGDLVLADPAAAFWAPQRCDGR